MDAPIETVHQALFGVPANRSADTLSTPCCAAQAWIPLSLSLSLSLSPPPAHRPAQPFPLPERGVPVSSREPVGMAPPWVWSTAMARAFPSMRSLQWS